MNPKIKELLKKTPLKIFTYYIASEAAIGFIEGVLSKANIYDVYRMIEEDRYNLFDGNPKVEKAIKKASRIITEYEKIIRESVTVENVLNVLKSSRPDIYSLIINHRKGVKWVENTIRESLDHLFKLAKSEST
jgi:hypothetical protein